MKNTNAHHDLADALAIVRASASGDDGLTARVITDLTEAELAAMVCNLAEPVVVARDAAPCMPLNQWAAQVLRAVDTPSRPKSAPASSFRENLLRFAQRSTSGEGTFLEV